ncbi:MAG: peptide chain release factor N(5)-glutamine methyltransferase [Pseudomonadota bacterium]
MSGTIGQVICWAQRRLTDAGLEEARLEARILTAHALGLERSALLAREPDRPPPGLAARLAPMLDRRAARIPLAHITGLTEFYGLPFKAGPGALIPRSDSETLVRVALDHLPPERPAVIADLGTGSGCLLVALLRSRPATEGTGVDASTEALAIAEDNARLNGVAGRARFDHMGWAAWQGWASADLIVSNPPYIRAGEIDALAPEVRDHDPRLALDGGRDGLDGYREIIGLGSAAMAPGTPLIFEIGHDQAESVTELLKTAEFSTIKLTRDLSGRPRVLSAVKKLT